MRNAVVNLVQHNPNDVQLNIPLGDKDYISVEIRYCRLDNSFKLYLLCRTTHVVRLVQQLNASRELQPILER